MFKNLLKSRKTPVLFILGVAVLGGLLAVKVLFFPQTPRESAAPSAPAASAAPSLSAVASSSASVGADGRAVCDVKVPAGKEFSAELPEDYVWEQTADDIHYPVSATYGPAVRQGRLGQCFAHNPTGAAMAAINASIVLGNPEISNRRVILSSRFDGRAEPWAPDGEKDGEKILVALYAYSIQGYSHDRATVKVYMMAQKPGGSISIGWVPIRMVWENGDWRLDSEESEMGSNLLTDSSQDPAQRFSIGQSRMTEWGFKR
ncbi:hypothetical protein [Rothia sp. HMSC075F09]|uniref:hypothetical protein n=1 Tax=Rothia sp. HMSC075F09 TaxID=1739253 RepID=UPI0008A29D94|nr:hypothetical protein [Rothia sp. HMSC075F09]OFL78118.1 hypothetical protein HMPREF2749_00075 [Rothia sp. HMSC075F09]